MLLADVLDADEVGLLRIRGIFPQRFMGDQVGASAAERFSDFRHLTISPCLVN
ncbi:MAG: hypothetical protein WA880_01545 [Ornithinimicrobium sp.]